MLGVCQAGASSEVWSLLRGWGGRRRAGLRKRLMAFCLSRCTGRHERQVVDRKRALLADLAGTILELGPGAGANLRYFRPGVRWIGVEPNPFLHPYLRHEAARLGRSILLLDGLAEGLPIADSSVDAVVSSLVLCSVRNLEAAVCEIRRVLRPGGRYIFLEHVAAPAGTGLRRLQRWVRPVSRFLADGCQPDRETWRALENAGFLPLTLEHFRVRVPIVSPHIAGLAVKSEADPIQEQASVPGLSPDRHPRR